MLFKVGGDCVKVQVVHSQIFPTVQVFSHQHTLGLVRGRVIHVHVTHSTVLQQQQQRI